MTIGDLSGQSLGTMAAHPIAPSPQLRGPLTDLSQVYTDNVDFVWRLVARLGVPPPAVPDLVQDVFLVVHRRLADFDGRASVRAWLAGIARGVVRNHIRSRAREKRRLLVLSACEPDPATAMDRRIEVGRAVSDFLDGLDEEQRLAIVLTDIEGLTPAEAAEALGVSRNTVYSRLRLARAKLKRHLEAVAPDSGLETPDGRT